MTKIKLRGKRTSDKRIQFVLARAQPTRLVLTLHAEMRVRQPDSREVTRL